MFEETGIEVGEGDVLFREGEVSSLFSLFVCLLLNHGVGAKLSAMLA